MSCDAACPAPPVDATISFFAGFDGILVAIVYGVLIVFSIVFQLIRAKLMKKIDPESLEEDAQQPFNSGNPDESLYRQKGGRGPKDNINDSQVTGT